MGDLKPTDNKFIVFNVQFAFDDNGVKRHMETVLLVFWRSGNMSTERMTFASTSNYIKETLVCGAYLEVENVGDLDWDIVVDACMKKKKQGDHPRLLKSKTE